MGEIAERQGNTTAQTRTPPSLPASLTGLVVWTDFKRKAHSLSRDLTDAEQRELAEISSTYSAMEAPGPGDRILRAVGRLLVTFPGQQLSEGAAKVRGDAYREALDDLPAWCVEQACRDWLRGDVAGEQNMAFAPSPPQLRKIALRHYQIMRGNRAWVDMMRRATTEPQGFPEVAAALEGVLS